MVDEPKMTRSTVKVLQEFLAHPEDEYHGFALTASTGVGSGTLYPMLDRLTAAGWLNAAKESTNAEFPGRPPRVMYCMTPLGAERAAVALATRGPRSNSGASRRPVIA